MIALVFAAGCDRPFVSLASDPPTTDLSPPTAAGSVRVTSGSVGCTVGGDAWIAVARADGWTRDGWLTIYRPSDGAFEDHPLPLVDTDLEGAWDERSVTLAVGTDTQFPCDEPESLVSFAVVLGADGSPGDCVEWNPGAAPAEAWMREHDPVVAALGGCRNLP